MGRVRLHIQVYGRDCWTLFDSGAENTYVTPRISNLLGERPLATVWRTHIGGKTHHIRHKCDLVAKVKGKPIEVEAYVLSSIGFDKKAGRHFDVLVGALAMQKWNIELDLKREDVDMRKYSREFVEFHERICQ